MIVDPYVLTFSLATVIATVWMGFWAARKSKTASDFFVAGRSVSVGWNASAISGEYLSAASFMGVAGMVMSSGYAALWYPVGYACGYLFLLLFIAGPLRRFGAYTIPDFAEGRYDSPVFRKIAVVFVLFIGFFYTMPQMKGAGTTLAYIFPGLPYWAGVVLVGAVITLNVALGGMKGITLVQAFQYWAKLFAISVPVFVLMAVYGYYNQHIDANSRDSSSIRASADVENPLHEAEQAFWEFTSELANPAPAWKRALAGLRFRGGAVFPGTNCGIDRVVSAYGGYASRFSGRHTSYIAKELMTPDEARSSANPTLRTVPIPAALSWHSYAEYLRAILATNGISVVHVRRYVFKVFPTKDAERYLAIPVDLPLLDFGAAERRPLPAKAPPDDAWLNPFGPLTTKAAKAAAAALPTNHVGVPEIALKAIPPATYFDFRVLGTCPLPGALRFFEYFVDRKRWRWGNSQSFDDGIEGSGLFSRNYAPPIWINFGTNRMPFAEAKKHLEYVFATNGMTLVPLGARYFRSIRTSELEGYRKSAGLLSRSEWLAQHERPLALLYTYSLIIALVCGTAGLPHILVRFYTNPDGAAAKRTTMWVMILIGVFYLFPPIFGVLGRNLLPELYGAAGAKGTDKIVLELPRILNERYGALGSILSGITCAGAFAAFMSTFSGLLVSMTGALAHDVYGRMLRPSASPKDRLRAFKVCAVVIGGIAILLGLQVEPLQINFMVGQAFAIAAASYFPLLFMSAWWRGMTMRGAATGMLTGGLLALTGISLTSFSDLKWLPLDGFWAQRPLLRILCEQPAIWAVPLAITLMVLVSKLTESEIPSDIRMKMLVLHAPEKLGLKQEYIREHQPGH